MYLLREYFVRSKVPGNSAGNLFFWDGENVTLSKVVGDLQRSGIKRSRLESPGSHFLFSPLPGEMFQFD